MEGCFVLNLGVRPLGIKSEIIREMWIPIIKIKPVKGSVLDVLKHMDRCDTIAFTSPRGPKVLYEELRKFGLLDEFLKNIKNKRVLAIGPLTGESVRNFFNINEVLMPAKFTSEDLASLILDLSPSPSCVLLVRSLKGSRELSEILSKNNVKHKEVFIYDEVVEREKLALLNDLVKNNKEKVVLVLTSSLIAEAFCLSIKDSMKDSYIIACIGPRTLRKAREVCEGKDVTFLMPKSFTYESLKKLIREVCGGKNI